MSEPFWVIKPVVLAAHEEQLAEHGGRPGIRDEGLLDSALARPNNLFVYEKPTLVELAACYGFGLVRNHPFIDGNKRVSFVVTTLFLDLNGADLNFDRADAKEQWEALAAGKVTEAELAAWLHPRLTYENIEVTFDP